MKGRILIFFVINIVILTLTNVHALTPEPSNDMSLYYHLDMNSSVGENETHVYDFSLPNKNNATIFGVAHTNNGLYDGAYEFDKLSTENITTKNDIVFNTSSSYTFMVWINPKQIDKDDYYTINTIFSLSNATNGFELYFYSWNGMLLLESAPDIYLIHSFQNVTKNAWRHLTVTYNKNSGNFSIYIDGSLDHTRSINVSNHTGKMVIGATQTNLNETALRQFNGTIDEFIIFNRALNSNEIERVYGEYIADFQFVPYIGANRDININAKNLTTSGTGFFDFLGSLTSKIKNIFAQNATIVKLIVTDQLIAPHDASQPERSLGVTYQNNKSQPIIVYGSVFIRHNDEADRARIILKTDSNNPPTTIIQRDGFENYPSAEVLPIGRSSQWGRRDVYLPFWMIVQPDHFYRIDNETSAASIITLDKWNEIDF